ncbi:hypothetical protein [Anditalea andensis]|uniref:hypothetical protein n=1 Tax=Anditalea andensis TaxID=1048983 RepID=UPI0013DFD343|nr:hypothetical protein [Anditalea andensis]
MNTSLMAVWTDHNFNDLQNMNIMMWKFDFQNFIGVASSYQRGWEKAIKALEIVETSNN